MKKRRLGLLSKMMLYYSAIMLVIVFALISAAYLYVLDVSRRNAEMNQQRLAEKTLAQVESYLAEMDQMARTVSTDAKIVNVFDQLLSDGDPSNYFDRNILEAIDTATVLTSYNGPDMTAWRISVYNASGDFISSGAGLSPGGPSARAGGAGFPEVALRNLERALADRPAPVIAAPERDHWSTLYGDARFASLYRAVTDYSGQRAYGVVEVQQEIAKLEAAIGQGMLAGNQTFVFDAGGRQVLPVPADGGGEGAAGGGGEGAAGGGVEGEAGGGGEGQGAAQGAEGAAAAQAADGGAAAAAAGVLLGDDAAPVPLGAIGFGLGGQDYVTRQESATYGWSVALVQSSEQIIRPFQSMVVFLYVGGVLVILVMLLAVYVISRRLSAPLMRLTQRVRGVTLDAMPRAGGASGGGAEAGGPPAAQAAGAGEGAGGVGASGGDHSSGRGGGWDGNGDGNGFGNGDGKNLLTRGAELSEVTELRGAFDAMLRRIRDSISLEQRAYLMALQSQMDPHFLFNSLAVISGMGFEGGNAKVVEACAKLSGMLRYSATYGAGATIGSELDHARNYLELMKFRFEDQFSYTISADEALLGAPMPRLVLQPVVENCFEHGFAGVDPPWEVRVVASSAEGGGGDGGAAWRFRIEDNGAGFGAREKSDLWRKVAAFSRDLPANYQEMKLGGLGLANTLVRLRLSMPAGFSFDIQDLSPSGTAVVLEGKVA
jgi:sensor histidine kinase YesM